MSTPHFKIVTLEQGTQAWREWRHNGIGASDASTIMGENRFKSAAQTGVASIEELRDNWAQVMDLSEAKTVRSLAESTGSMMG